MALANPTWGEERIAAELLLKLGIRVSPRTVRRYLPSGGGSGTRRISQCWTTFVRNHVRAVLACDFLVAVTVRFRLLYVFVVLDVGTRRIVHWNVTEHPTADWTQQQFGSGQRAHCAQDHVDRHRRGHVPCAARRRAQVLAPRGRVALRAEFSHTTGPAA